MKKIAILTMLLLASPAWADETPRLVHVTGEAEVAVVPDEVWVNFLVETFDPALANAKKANDDAVKGVLAIVKKYKVSEKDFKTDFFNVRNEERYYFDAASQQQRSKRGFFVTKNVAVVLRDITKFEALYSEALESGANNITGVEFKTSQLPSLRAQARKLAVQSAKQKASQLAAELGEQLGRPYQVSENAQSEPWPRPVFMAAKMAMADSAGPASNETIALGQIKIASSVSASFELK